MEETEKNRVTVEIYGRPYTIVGPESATWIREVALYVDEQMNQISQKHKHLDATKVAVLSAVNITDEYFRLQEKYHQLLEEMEARDMEGQKVEDREMKAGHVREEGI